MSDLADRIAKFRNMATLDPDNELGHFRLGQLLQENQQFAEAVQCFERTLELSPQFSKVFQLLGDCHIKLGQTEQAIAVLQKGFAVADERGDRIPRDAMKEMLIKLGAAPPEAVAAVVDDGPETGFKCERPGCMA
ncbi:MAG: tetratricopeptide repeat protein, partial [Gemmataceae bacterium]